MVELLVVLLIVGILCVMGISKNGGLQAKELQFGDDCGSDLKIIYNAEKEYRVEQGSYLSAADVNQINSQFGIFIQNHSFNFQVQSTPGGFEATATRKNGTLCEGKRMSITQSGEIKKGCSFW